MANMTTSIPRVSVGTRTCARPRGRLPRRRRLPPQPGSFSSDRRDDVTVACVVSARHLALQILGGEAGSFRDSGEHLRPNFLIVVEREHDIRPIRASQDSVGARLALDGPAKLLQRHEHAPGFGGRPVAHAAWNVTLRNSAGAS